MIYDKIPGLNAEMLLDLYEDTEDIFLAVLRSWLNDTSSYINKLANVSAETLKDYCVAIHGLKGTSASIGAESISQKAKKLEAMAKAGDLAGVQAQNESLLKEVDAMVKTIQNWLAQNKL